MARAAGALLLSLLAAAVAGETPSSCGGSRLGDACYDEDNDQNLALLQSTASRRTASTGGGAISGGRQGARGAGAWPWSKSEDKSEDKAAETKTTTKTAPIKLNETWHDDIDHPDHSRDTAAQVLGVSANAEGDLAAFAGNLGFTSAFVAGCLAGFCVLRIWYPPMFSNNAAIKTAPDWDGERTGIRLLFGWAYDSLRIDDDGIEQAAGLDGLMLIKFLELCCKICVVLLVPNLLIMGALHRFYGERDCDTLSKIGYAAVHQGSWLCYVHALLVWFVVIVVSKMALNAHHSFIEDRRYNWLCKMPVPQSTSVLVECIPDAYRSDDKLYELFERMFGQDRVQMAHMVLNTDDLLAEVNKKESYEFELQSAEYQWKKDDNDPSKRPQFHDREKGFALVDTINTYTEKKKASEQLIATMRSKLLKDATDLSSQVCTTSGFVTFKRRHEQELALQLCYTEDTDEFVVSIPPDPVDIIYSDLQADPTKIAGKEVLGRACVAGIYLGFMPIVLGISWLTSIPELESRYPGLKTTLDAWPNSVVSFMSSMSAVLGLKLFMCFLPTFLMIIFRNFWCLRAGAWAQSKLQVYYFWFLVIFEILATTVGTSLIGTVNQLIDNPTSVFALLGESLPQATHFYLNYMVVNWGTQALDSTRYFYLAKFIAYKAMLPESQAREKSEPEDQDYYGQGGRSARFCEAMAMVLVFASLSPLIIALGLINFCLCRLIFGYLLVWAETKKPDLGGVFWVTNLRHLQCGLFLYVLTMAGCLMVRSYNNVPPIICASSAVWLYRTNRKFESLLWLKLPMVKFGEEADAVQTASKNSYRQPELLEAKDGD